MSRRRRNNNNTFRTLLQYMFTCWPRNSQRCLEIVQEPPIPLYIETLPYPPYDQVFPIELYELPELPLSAYNAEFEQSDVMMITPLSVGSSLMHLFTEVEEYISKITDYGIDQFIEELLTHVYKEIVSPAGAAGDLTSIPSTEGCMPLHTDSSHGLFTPFSELELGNTKEYPFPEHFRGWRDSISVASSFDPDTVWEIMKGPDPPPTYRTPLHMCIRNWCYRIVGSASFVVCWLICCLW